LFYFSHILNQSTRKMSPNVSRIKEVAKGNLGEAFYPLLNDAGCFSNSLIA